MFSPRRAAIDLDHITKAASADDLAMSFYRALEEDDSTLHFKLFYPDEPLPLSDVMPIFDNLGFRVIGEHPFEVIDRTDRKSTRLNSSHVRISYAVFCLKKKKTNNNKKSAIQELD